ncbi:THAP domain-containing protein 1 B-like [Bufo gargarizans]|uniref:THAP domain-containing protein 1 B-like n=1 Tax=Bufo bufo TaxID=8384 RepID=UPI001ABE2ADB|nr:THAP domain-containing protein 1 B-like [Bufo bufo]XP_044141741.1 THAP domain-containing protein 1 B-like [Bufo gargarizans]XP_044141745.1 THAP domain-containing protein 1 B-like [Bufo gargarizans]XP_044141750.1 THAP domain-containing protein 1 B-like [Bufo gargarizans]
MPACAAINCTSRQTRGCGKSFHRFPHGRPEILKKWVTNMRRDTFKPSSKAVLCSDHFEECCFDRTGQTIRLRVDAVPTVFAFPGKARKDRKSQIFAPVLEDVEDKFSIPTHSITVDTPAPDPVNKRVTVEHDYCITDSPKALKRRLDEALSSLHNVKRRLKITQQKFRRLKFKVQSLDLTEDPV